MFSQFLKKAESFGLFLAELMIWALGAEILSALVAITAEAAGGIPREIIFWPLFKTCLIIIFCLIALNHLPADDAPVETSECLSEEVA